MNPSTLLIAAVFLVCAPLHAAPPAPNPDSTFSGADQKLIDRYTAALGDKFGFAPWTVEGGLLKATVPGGEKVAVDIREARSEDEIETRIFSALESRLPKAEAGEAKVPVYFAGATADDFKDVLDLKAGKLTLAGAHQADIEFTAGDKPARRVILRKGEGGAVSAFLEGDGYAYAAGRVVGGTKTERDPVKSGAASVFFEMNAWMQKTLKAADARAAKANPRGLSDGGYRHPEFEKLMGQLKSGLASPNLDKAFDNAGDHAPADLQARAQAAQALISSGYGGAARWKINSNGKYADAQGNLTLMVRVKDGPGGKIEETPVVIKKDAHGRYDLASAVGPITRLLLNGDAVAAKAAAMKAAVSATPGEVVGTVVAKPSVAVGTGALGLPAGSLKDRPLQPSLADTLKAAGESYARLDPELLRELKAPTTPCEGAACLKPVAPVVAKKPDARNPPVADNRMCVLSRGAGENAAVLKNADEPVADWVTAFNHPVQRSDGNYATAVACVDETIGSTDASMDEAKRRVVRDASCTALAGADAVAGPTTRFRSTEPGKEIWCSQALLKMRRLGS